MSLFLAENMDTGVIVLLGVLLLLLLASPIIMRVRNKKDMNTAQQMLDSLKKGDEIITAAGVIGKIISIDTRVGYKTVTIETGNEKHKGYETLDINAVYMNLSALPKQEEVKEKPEEKVAVKEEVLAEPAATEEKVEEKTEENVEKPAEKKPRARKSSKNSK